MFAIRREDIRAIESGMIGAIVGSSKIGTGDTLCDPRNPILLDTISIPSTVINVVVEPETDDDAAKIMAALDLRAREDPSFRVKTDPESGQILLSGMGELHLEIVVERLRRELGVNARVGRQQVAKRENIPRPAEGANQVERP